MGKGSSAPPDYAAAAQQTAAGNLQNLNAQTRANRPDQITPFGTSTWSQQGFDQDAYNRAIADWQAAGSDPKTRPNTESFAKWSNTVALTPSEQAALDAQQKVQLNQSTLGADLQGRVADTMKAGFNAPNLADYTGKVGNVQTNFSGFSPNGVGQVNQQMMSPLGFMRGNLGVDQTAPQFDASTAAAGTKAAFDAQTGLLKDGWQQDTDALDSKLRLQGLQPGTQAYDTAMQNLLRVQGQQKDQIANQSVVTGNDMANQNYASSLAGFGQTNAARTQAQDNALKSFAAMLSGQGAYNQSQQQAYNQSLGTYGANTAAAQASNEAQAQAYAQALQNYQNQYQSNYSNYMMPLNAMNAVLNGNQVQNPTFNGFSQAGYTPGADYSGAASALGQWQSAQDATNAAGFGSILGAVGTLGAAGIKAGMFSDIRLKTNIKRIGRTRAGHGWYSWNWKHNGKKAQGVIAQDVRKVMPHAVVKARNGYLAVDYAQVA